jgi:TolA-binding protein
MLAYIKTNNLQEAMKISNSLKEEFPESEEAAEALYYQGIILFKQNRKQDASEKFTKFASDFPSNPITPDALFRKGEILITLKKKAEAIETFSEIISKYPESSAAPAALYRIFICEYILGNVEKARTAIDSLTQNYPDSKFSVSALFWLADNCRVAREYTEATAILKKIREKYRNSPENVSKALYDEAWIKNLTGNYAEALTLLKELNEKYSDSSINVEGLFLAGDALSAQGKYEEASDYYNKAAKRRPESTLAMAAEGRAADCAFSMYSKTFKKEYIQQAVESYKKILGDKKISPDTRNQTLFKLGKCYETIEMKRKALEKFKELIYLYKTETENGQKVDKIWAVKAATEAVAIYMRENIPEAAAEAVKIYKNLMKINIDQALEYEKNIKKIKEKFKI